MPKIKDMPIHERPREKLLEKGSVNLKDKELLAILFRTGRKGKNAIEIADEILKKHPMKQLLKMSLGDLIKIDGIDIAKACTLLSAFEITKRAMEVEDNNLPTILSAKDAVAQLQELRSAKKEHFVVLYLNARNQLVYKEVISIGTINASIVHPREIFKPAIEHLSIGVIIAHNHPSGDADPSVDDLKLTDRLTEAGKLMGIEVIDHIIITKDNFKSIKDK